VVPILLEHMGHVVLIKERAYILYWSGLSPLEGGPCTESNPQDLFVGQAILCVQEAAATLSLGDIDCPSVVTATALRNG
jgi:hypothetical protein